MNKQEFISYISKDNSGNYKQRKIHIQKVAPEILLEITNHINKYGLHPLHFNDGLNYYLNDIKVNKLCICGKQIYSYSFYCSTLCKNKDINTVLQKSKNTLYDRYGTYSTLKIKQFSDKKKTTCLNKYGTEYASQNKDIKLKIKNTNIETYSNLELRNNLSQKISLTYQDHHDEIIEKRKQTNLLKYGEYTAMTFQAIKKQQNAFLNKYGTSNPFLIHEDTKEKAKQGKILYYKNEENKNKSIEKRLNTIIKKYGSLEEMNYIIFNKNKQKIINKIIDSGIKEKIIEYVYEKPGFIKCECECGHVYEISLHLLRERHKRNDIICTTCSPVLSRWISNAEIELYNWLSQYVNCENNNRKILPKSEIDIYIPEKNIAIEFNGIYWHSDLFKDKNYHLNKTLLLKEKNISLIHIWEDQWETKKDIIKERLLSKLNLTQNKINIGARKCTIEEVSNKEIKFFLEKNHLQGHINSSINIVLKYEGEIISCLSIGKRKIGKNNNLDYEILRFCNKININCPGSFSKLFKYASNKYKGKYITYSDLCWGEGNVYKSANFIFDKYTNPNYWYFIENKRYHRYTFNKQRLIKLGYDKNKTEQQIMNEDIKALRIFDCGQAVWKYKTE
jgi:hypothetical protein